MSAPESQPSPGTASRTRLSPEQLRWFCDPAELDFETTEEVDPITNVVGQESAIAALQFGLQVNAPGQNVFIRGLEGTGRLMLLRRMLEETRLACPVSPDRCVVRNFEEPDRPHVIELPRGTARGFQYAVEDFVRFMVEDLGPALGGEALRARRDALDEVLKTSTAAIVKPFEEKLAELNLALVTVSAGSTQHPAIVPRIDGEPVMPEAYDASVEQGKVTAEERDRVIGQIQEATPELQELSNQVERLQVDHQAKLRALIQGEARAILAGKARRVLTTYNHDVARDFLDAVIEDFIEHRIGHSDVSQAELARLYAVNVIVAHRDDESCPVIVESAPSLQNLLGRIDAEHTADGGVRVDHTQVRAGSLLRASGGFLLIEARDLLDEPGAWKVLMRSLRTRHVEIVPPEMAGNAPLALKPEPAPVDLKVVLIGDPGMYLALEDHDPDFGAQFKVLVDFEPTLSLEDGAVGLYAGVLAQIARKYQLPPLHRSAVAGLAEYGARIAGRSDQLTTRFGRVVDILHEAAFLVRRDGGNLINAEAIDRAIAAMRARAGSPGRRFRRAIREGILRIETSGLQVAQINGLAVIHAGPLTYGFPSRVTATIGPGTKGAINIEHEAELSGSIHTKGFYILEGLMRHLLRTDHPLTYSASIAFEQSYGGIDGDSASGAEACCLLSALTGVPLRQDLAMTGAIDQHGAIQAIGAATEKIEGFFDTCVEVGLSGTQGVIIPRANVKDLMLRREVVDACREGKFHIHAVARIEEALALFTGMEIGLPDEDGNYPDGTLLARAVEQAWHYWLMASARGPVIAVENDLED